MVTLNYNILSTRTEREEVETMSWFVRELNEPWSGGDVLYFLSDHVISRTIGC